MVTYLSEIINALVDLDGDGTLKEICEHIKRNNKLPALQTNINWQRNVSTELQRHCSETKSYRGAEDLFYSVYGLGEGCWGLRSYVATNNKEISSMEKRQIENIYANEQIKETEKDALIKARVGQGVFRNKLIEKYHNCIITGVSDKRLLLASHVKPWRYSDNLERLSEENGLLLSPMYDKMFDLGLITFSKDAKIIISPQITQEDKNILSINTEHSFIKDISKELKLNLEFHRDVIFKSNNNI